MLKWNSIRLTSSKINQYLHLKHVKELIKSILYLASLLQTLEWNNDEEQNKRKKKTNDPNQLVMFTYHDWASMRLNLPWLILKID